MGYFVCKHCGAHLHDSKVEDLYQWEDKESIGWSYVCPRCKEENYKEIKFLIMTQEEKAKAYDKALERAKEQLEGAKVFDYKEGQIAHDIRTTTYAIFPELKESEDERIRTAIIHFISHTPTVPKGIIGKETMLVWLEKQGKQKEYTFKSIPRLLDMIEPSDKAKTYCQKLIDTLVKEGYAIDAKIVGECLKTMNGEDVPMAIMDEKQGEYKFEMKSAEESLDIDSETYNKIVDKCIYSEQNPKFKKDDWITNGIETVQITGYDIDYGYQVDYKGNLQHRDTDIIEKEYHLWTIQDAKDGDVLAVDSKPFIYNGSKNEVTVGAYCGFNSEHKFSFAYNYVINQNITPATKKQRDILFQKMKESGYEWDDEKKELKKIEKKSQRMVSAEAKEALYDKPTDEEMKELLRTEYEKGRADTIAEMYVPTQISPEESLGISSEEYNDIVNECLYGESNSSNKIEPKFHEGDWVVNKLGNSWHIDSFDKKNYQVSDGNGNYNYFPISKQDRMHLWTIQDAKDGDVLKEDSCTFIIERMKPDGTAIIHCCLFDDGDFDLGSTLGFDVDSTYPATKEQRDTLMKAMADAGWEFDFKKKELKKIEKKSDEYSDTERQEMFIKSQRPHFWKPSDEQMKALKYVAYHLMPDTNYREEMFLLYNDLKKLK